MAVLMRWLAMVMALAAVGCTPDIGPGTYYCGPERLCPPDQACNDNTFTCEDTDRAERFSCPMDSESSEPDEDIASARDMGVITCGGTLVGGLTGCIAAQGNVDVYKLELDTSCAGADPHLEVRISFPIALAGLQVELLDDSGSVVATGELCTEPVSFTGKERVCLDATIGTGVHYVRVKVASDALDCGGDCHHNQYTIEVKYPLS